MKKIKEIVLVTFLFFTYSVTSQTSSAPAGNNTALKEAAIKANQKRAQTIQKSSQSLAVSSPAYIGAINENDQYMGKEKEFLNMITLNSLPSDFPKYQKGWSFVVYDNLTEVYFKNHKDIIKEAFKAKF